MKFTLIPEDNAVIVDGNPKFFAYEIGNNNIHAVQWYGEYGNIEYKQGPAEHITDMSPYQSIIDQYNAQGE